MHRALVANFKARRSPCRSRASNDPGSQRDFCAMVCQLLWRRSGRHVLGGPRFRQWFHGLELDGVIGVRVGVGDGEPRHRGVWIWDSRREADLALAHVSPTEEPCLEAAPPAAQDLIERSRFHIPAPNCASGMGLPPLLAPIGWTLTALPDKREHAAWVPAVCRRLASRRSPHLTPLAQARARSWAAR